MDIQPVVRGHMLVVPRRHTTYLADLEVEDGAAQLASAAVRASELRCEGVNLFSRMARLLGRTFPRPPSRLAALRGRWVRVADRDAAFT